MLHQFHDLTFGDAPDLVEVQAAFAFGLQRIYRRAKKSVGDDGDRRRDSTDYGQCQFPIGKQCIQRAYSIQKKTMGWESCRTAACSEKLKYLRNAVSQARN